MRVAFTGGPKTGKTTLAGPNAMHTDRFVGLPWENQADEVAKLLEHPGDDLKIEGVTVAVGLRRWLLWHPEGKPVDIVNVLHHPFEEINTRQQMLAERVYAMMEEIHHSLKLRGVLVVDFTGPISEVSNA